MRWPAGSSANSERSAAADRPRARSAAAAGVSADGARSWPELPEHSERGRAAVRTSPAACGSRRISGLSRSFHRCRTVRAVANPHRRPRRMTPLSADERIGRRAEAAPVFPGRANALTHEDPVSGEPGAGPKAAPVFPGHANALTHESPVSGESDAGPKAAPVFPGTRKRPLARGPRFRRTGRRAARRRTPVLDRREPDISRAGAVRSPSSAWGDERSGMQVPNRKIIYNDSYV
ncbi:hypothetical protein BN3659_01110 [Alistipes sp. CHKCI003]|nr:hypothetical protein BN3659_01110 [Alistipes sp. CHKCI003]